MARESTTVDTPARRAARRIRRPMSASLAGSEATAPSTGTSSSRATRTAPETAGRMVSFSPMRSRPTSSPASPATPTLAGRPRGSDIAGTNGLATMVECPVAAASSASRLRSPDRSLISRSIPANRFCTTGSLG